MKTPKIYLTVFPDGSVIDPQARRKTMQWLPRVFFLMFIALISGCGGESGLSGKWVFDKSQTEAQLIQTPEPEREPSLLGIQEELTASLIPIIIGKMGGATLNFTSKELMITGKDGSGQAMPYEIIEQPTPDSWRIKTSDGTVTTYHREGPWLASDVSGDVRLRVYFARVPK